MQWKEYPSAAMCLLATPLDEDAPSLSLWG